MKPAHEHVDEVAEAGCCADGVGDRPSICRFMLISLEIMINAAALAFVVAGSYWGQADGQIMYILAISLAAAEASIGLALLLQLHRRRQNLNIDSVSELRG